MLPFYGEYRLSLSSSSLSSPSMSMSCHFITPVLSTTENTRISISEIRQTRLHATTLAKDSPLCIASTVRLMHGRRQSVRPPVHLHKTCFISIVTAVHIVRLWTVVAASFITVSCQSVIRSSWTLSASSHRRNFVCAVGDMSPQLLNVVVTVTTTF